MYVRKICASQSEGLTSTKTKPPYLPKYPIRQRRITQARRRHLLEYPAQVVPGARVFVRRERRVLTSTVGRSSAHPSREVGGGRWYRKALQHPILNGAGCRGADGELWPMECRGRRRGQQVGRFSKRRQDGNNGCVGCRRRLRTSHMWFGGVGDAASSRIQFEDF